MSAETFIKAFKDYIFTEADPTDFILNVRAIINAGYVYSRQIPFIVGSMFGFMKRQAKAKAPKYKDEYFGEIKKRYEIEVTVESVIITEGFYGNTYIHKFVDAEGHSFVWFGSKKLNVEDGDVVVIRATVVDHEVYNGVKQTKINRVQLV